MNYRAYDLEINRMFYLGDIYEILRTQEGMDDQNWLLCTKHKLMMGAGELDSNGKEIYEGDIVDQWGDKTNVFVIYSIEQAHWKIGECTLGDSAIVLGNIYENPELLEEKKDE